MAPKNALVETLPTTRALEEYARVGFAVISQTVRC